MLEQSVNKYKETIKDVDGALIAEKVRSAEKDRKISEQQLEVDRMKFAVRN